MIDYRDPEADQLRASLLGAHLATVNAELPSRKRRTVAVIAAVVAFVVAAVIAGTR